MQITDIHTLRASSKELDADITAVLAKYGMKLDRRTARIGIGKLELKITALVGSAEEQEAQAKARVNTAARVYGIAGEVYGREIRFGGEVFRVVDADLKNPKNCFSLTRVRDGKGYKCSAEHIRRAA